MLSAAGPERTWIDLTSAAPIVGRRFAAAAKCDGVPFLCAPLGGGPTAARSGNLTLYVGGDAAVYARHQPLFDTIANPAAVHHVGSPEAGYAAKLLVNLLWFAQAAVHGEALLLGQSVGLAPDALHELLAGSPAASVFNTQYIPRLLAGDYVPDFSTARIAEELSGLEALATEQGMPFGVSAAVSALHAQAAERFDGADGELLGIAELEAQAGARLR
jgi:3-hydroxyisobutyrate dehydrogenase